MHVNISNKESATVIMALIKDAAQFLKELYKSPIWNCGKELADHKCFTLATYNDACFCDPQSPWQLGSSKNTNRSLGRYFSNARIYPSIAEPIKCGK